MSNIQGDIVDDASCAYTFTPKTHGVRCFSELSPDSGGEPSPAQKKSSLDLEGLWKRISLKMDEMRLDHHTENQQIRKAVAALRTEIRERDVAIHNLEGNIGTINTELNELRTQLASKDACIDRLEEKADELEQRERLMNLRINGIGPFKEGDDYIEIVKNLGVDAGVVFAPGDVDVSHPTGENQLIVRFGSRTARAKFYSNKAKLKEKHKNVYVNEDLTARRLKLLMKLVGLKKGKVIDGAWSAHGRLYVKKDDHKIEIKRQADIDNLE
jgi:hypothetical protein